MTGSCDKEARNFLSTPENDPCRTRGDYNMLRKQTKWSDVRILPLRPSFQGLILSTFFGRNEMRNEIGLLMQGPRGTRSHGVPSYLF